MSPNSLASLPNLLSLARVPLGIGVFVCIAHNFWEIALAIFLVATLTDWLDGWVARRYKLESPVGRSLDPLTDKFLICGTFIFLQSANVGIYPWMVTVIVGREILITGIRGIVESMGKKFGADWFGKLKTVLQCTAIIVIMSTQSFNLDSPVIANVGLFILYGMLVATIGSGLQYLIKASKLLSQER